MLTPRRFLNASFAVAFLALAPTASADDLELTRIYRGADGSALYTRDAGKNKIVGFGEHPGTRFAFVFEGKRVGTTISGHWWNVAKGRRAGAGDLSLDISDDGARLDRTGGDDLGPESWTATTAEKMSWPGTSEAGFQSTSATDLDGAFAGSDRSRAYVRENATAIVGVAEKGRWKWRPKYATVFIGERTPAGTLAGSFYDVPKGRRLRQGSVTGDIGSSPRRFTLKLYDGAPDPNAKVPVTSYAADYAVDFDRFAQEIEQRLEPYVVGYGYAIANNGAVVRKGAGGARRVPQPTNSLTAPFAFTPMTVNETASTTKTVTAVAVARALEREHLTLDDRVDPYLPAEWIRGPGMTTVTFRQLLAHSGLKHPPGNICSTDPYACLEQAVALGMTAPPGYNNVHYTIFRVILPFVTDKAAMTELFAEEPDAETRNEVFSAAFRDEVVGMLTTAGVSVDFAYPLSKDVAWRYTWGTPPTNEYFPATDELHYLEAGSGGLKMNAVDYVRFLSSFEHSHFLSPAGTQALKDDRLGFDDRSKSFVGTGGVGPLYEKSGGSGGGASRSMIFPGDVQAFITRNSNGHPAQPNDAKLLRAAWEAALI
jgi:CubicO group peptidase (beta-lactamase class C family)